MATPQGSKDFRTVSEESLVPFSTWIHFKGGSYTVLGIATCSDNGPERSDSEQREDDEGKRRSVVYLSHKY